MVNDGSVVVEGTVHNRNDQAIDGFLLVVLTVDGLEVDSVSLPMQIREKAVASYDTTFPVVVRSQGGRVVATVQWDKER